MTPSSTHRTSSPTASNRSSAHKGEGQGAATPRVRDRGWHPGEGGRSGQLGSLLVGFYEGDTLRLAGKVGTGFKADELRRLGGLLDDLASDDCPFQPSPPAKVSRTARWVRPLLVAEITFAEWTSDGVLRHPSYIATRDDKDPHEVVREA